MRATSKTIIERGIKLERLDILLTAGTGYGSLRNWHPEVENGKSMREDICEGVKLFAFCKNVPKCESQTSSEEEAVCLITLAKRLMKVNQLGCRSSVLHSTWAALHQHKCSKVRGTEMYFSTSVESRLFGRTFHTHTPCQCGCSRSECRWRLLQDLCEFSLLVSKCQP